MTQAANANEASPLAPMTDKELADMHDILKKMFNGAVSDHRNLRCYQIRPDDNPSIEQTVRVLMSKGTVAQTATALLAAEAEIRERQSSQQKLGR